MDYSPQFVYCSESEWGKFVSYNNIRDRPTNFRSNENDVSCLTKVHVKSVRDLKEVFNLKRYNNFDKLIRVTCFVYRFIFNCKKKIHKEKHLRIVCFKNEEIGNITNNSKIMTDLRGNLNVFSNDDGNLRVKKHVLKIHHCLIPASIQLY